MKSSLDIAKYFIIKAYEDGRENLITNMKIQKLLYYSQCLYLALYHEPLFTEEIQAWRYGPVCPPAYHFYSEFEAKQLPIPDSKVLTELIPEITEILDKVWDYFGAYHAYDLSDLTHLEFPWKKARKGLPPQAASTAVIPLEDMRLLGEEKLLEIEQAHPCYAPIVAQFVQEACDKLGESKSIEQGEVHDWLKSLLAGKIGQSWSNIYPAF
ncbi:Panacea domain-containing protein [Spirulina subsalsa]|uniref:Panacea domain-containing protein n=1 Tax=Spirulina subsalsa TaxID=54311 RepID=UPI0002EA3E02|nr:type II toxin-antitoxin system antitoxin SocA domain-containing protein [Spirulina subsalsa]